MPLEKVVREARKLPPVETEIIGDVLIDEAVSFVRAMETEEGLFEWLLFQACQDGPEGMRDFQFDFFFNYNLAYSTLYGRRPSGVDVESEGMRLAQAKQVRFLALMARSMVRCPEMIGAIVEMGALTKIPAFNNEKISYRTIIDELITYHSGAEVRAVLQHGADYLQVDEFCEKWVEELADACTDRGNDEIWDVVALLIKYRKLDPSKPVNGIYPIHYFCQAGCSQAIGFLHKQGVDISICDEDGRQAVHYLMKGLVEAQGCFGSERQLNILNNALEVLRELLTHGVDIFAPCPQGKTIFDDKFGISKSPAFRELFEGILDTPELKKSFRDEITRHLIKPVPDPKRDWLTEWVKTPANGQAEDSL